MTDSVDLTHFGVKGMQWGVRKDKHIDTRPDAERFGRRGARRIEKRMLKGKTHAQAVQSEKRRRRIVRVAATLYAASVAANLFTRFGTVPLQRAAASRAAAAGARAASDAFADSRGLTSMSVINLSFNAAGNIWE